MLTLTLIILILIVFALMTKQILKQEVAMPLLALSALILSGEAQALKALHNGFVEFSRIAVLFTAVAVPAHILQRSKLLDWIGMWIGEAIGRIHNKTKVNITILVPAFGLTMVYVLAALFHNTTSILISAFIIFIICKSYNLKALPVLCGALIASNLGGFSTRWGDTPNIIEAAQWGLNHQDFFKEILPLNIFSLIILIFVISLWLSKITKKDSKNENGFATAHAMIRFRNARRDTSLDLRLALVGLLGLLIVILGSLFYNQHELAFSALAIIISVFGDYNEHRSEALLALGIETYATLASIFVLAQVLAYSNIGIGASIQHWLTESEMSVWAISSTSYIGTLLTEAASWASAVAPIVHSKAPTHQAAWALGAGIFAGSSSLITAASAGIILTQETKNFPKGSQVTFGSYAFFGLGFSLLMLIYYVLLISLIFK